MKEEEEVENINRDNKDKKKEEKAVDFKRKKNEVRMMCLWMLIARIRIKKRGWR